MATATLDSTDLKIVAALQEDGRLSNVELAERIGLSASPCLRRVRRLEEAGLIRGYVALIDPQAVDLPVTAFVRVRLDRQTDSMLAEFEEAVTAFPEVMECYLMSGEADYQMRVVVRSLAAFESFLREKLTRIASLAQITSSFALRPVVYKTSLPVRGLSSSPGG